MNYPGASGSSVASISDSFLSDHLTLSVICTKVYICIYVYIKYRHTRTRVSSCGFRGAYGSL